MMVAGRRSQVAGLACCLVAAFAADVRSQNKGQWQAPFNHSGTTIGSGSTGWPSSFNAVDMAVIPNTSPTGANPNDVVIAWDYHWRNPATQSYSIPWEQRYTVGNPEVSSSFENRWVTIPLGPGGLFYGDLFCAGHCWLPDGRLFIAGGNVRYAGNWPQNFAQDTTNPVTTFTFLGSRYVGIWNPQHARSAANSFGWNHLAGGPLGTPMRLPRWYPTCTLISDRYVVVAGGVTEVKNPAWQDPAWDTYELFDLSTMDWVRDTNGEPKLFDGPRGSFLGGNNQLHRLGEYPRMHFLSNNRVVCSGGYPYSATVDPDPALTASSGSYLPPAVNHWSPLLASLSMREYGCSVLVPNVGNVPGLRDEVMIIGGGHYSSNTVSSLSQRLLAGSTGSAWGSTQSFGTPRMVCNAVLMPNGDIVLIGGSSGHYHVAASQRIPVYQTMVWDRANGWQGDASQVGKRMYHSTAALLPSGRVVSAGGDERTAIAGGWADWEVYAPRNLANGQTQPQFAGTWAATGFRTMAFGSVHTIEFSAMDDDPVSRVVLMRPCSTTHHSDMDQRYVELPVSLFESNDQVTVTAPAPPSYSGTAQGSVQALHGWYMLFLVTASGTTSPAKWVRLS